MRKILTAAALLASAALAACDTGTDNVSAVRAVAAANADQPILDTNGHPLLLPNSDPGVTVFENELLKLVNDYRLSINLQPLIPETVLGDAARANARHMIDHRFVSHISPEGFLPGERLSLLKVDWTAASENIASAYSTPQDVFNAWLNSPTHKSRIESDRFTHAGVGYQQDSSPTPEFAAVHYWSMLFLQH
jgi:uncharacterized protein YkwD